jgi:hypothetical protein
MIRTNRVSPVEEVALSDYYEAYTTADVTSSAGTVSFPIHAM